jgi:hypothetical protein
MSRFSEARGKGVSAQISIQEEEYEKCMSVDPARDSGDSLSEGRGSFRMKTD